MPATKQCWKRGNFLGDKSWSFGLSGETEFLAWALLGPGFVGICLNIMPRPNPHWTWGDATRCANASGTFSYQWECSHWTQTTAKELPANLHAHTQCGLGLKIRSTHFEHFQNTAEQRGLWKVKLLLAQGFWAYFSPCSDKSQTPGLPWSCCITHSVRSETTKKDCNQNHNSVRIGNNSFHSTIQGPQWSQMQKMMNTKETGHLSEELFLKALTKARPSSRPPGVRVVCWTTMSSWFHFSHCREKQPNKIDTKQKSIENKN